MDLLGRTYEIAWCETFECDGPAVSDPDAPGTCDDCGQPLVRKEVVRADRLRGAVSDASEVARLRTALEQIADDDCGTWDQAMRYAREVLAAEPTTTRGAVDARRWIIERNGNTLEVTGSPDDGEYGIPPEPGYVEVMAAPIDQRGAV